MRTRLIVAMALFSLLLLAAATQLPAYQAYRWSGIDERLQLTGLSGTAWHGRAASVTISGYPLGALEWRLHPVDLLLLRVTAELDISSPDGSASALMRHPLSGGKTEMSGLTISLPASWLQVVLQEPLFQLQGRLEMQFEQLEVGQDGSISGLIGQMLWQQAGIAGAMVTALGDLKIDWHSEAGVLLGELSDNGGPLALAGQVSIAQGRYQVAARLSARGDNQPLRQALNVLGRPGPDGWLSLNIDGPMIPLGALLQ